MRTAAHAIWAMVLIMVTTAITPTIARGEERTAHRQKEKRESSVAQPAAAQVVPVPSQVAGINPGNTPKASRKWLKLAFVTTMGGQCPGEPGGTCILAGVSVTLLLLPFLGIEGSALLGEPMSGEPKENGNFIDRSSISGVWFFHDLFGKKPDQYVHFVPYMKAGVVWQHVNCRNDRPCSLPDSFSAAPTLQVGVGIDMRINDRLTLGLEVSGIVPNSSTDDTRYAFLEQGSLNMSLTIGGLFESVLWALLAPLAFA